MTTPSFLTQWAEAARRLVNQAGEIALQANTQIAEEKFSTEKWARSTQQLVNLALTTGLEMTPIPCPPHVPDPRDLSDFISVAPDDKFQRTLSVVGPFVQEGVPSRIIPIQSIFFVPTVVRVHVTKFRVGVNWPDLCSGTYRGMVRLTQIGSEKTVFTEEEVTIDL